MTIYEYGTENEKKVLFIATAALEPYWAFQKQAESLGEDYHVYAVAADGHDGQPGDFISIEKTVSDMTEELKRRGVTKLYAAYGLSMGGAIVVRFLATSGIPVERAIIDGGILPYTYPKWVCKLIHMRDFISMWSITRSRKLLELVAPPEKYTAEGNNPKEEYDALMEFYKTYSNMTISKVFWSANNYELPHPAPNIDTKIEYWYGEYERKARKNDMAYIKSYFVGVTFRQINGMAHGELVMVYLSRFDKEIKALLEDREETSAMIESKPDYANWMPKSMVNAAAAGTGALLTADIATHIITGGNCTAGTKAICTALTLGTAACAVTTGYFYALRRAFDYDGKRKLSKQIIEGIADYVTIPDGGIGLDVGCGSAALTIACAKRNPNAEMVGCDIWIGAYSAVFSKELCEKNAKAEGVANVRFEEGNAMQLPYADETFDAVTSNYVYHNIVGKDKQTLLLETLRVLKKGGIFAIHDLMSKARYGDIHTFVQKLKDMGYENVRLINTTDGSFMSRKEAVLLGLGGSTLLIGKK